MQYFVRIFAFSIYMLNSCYTIKVNELSLKASIDEKGLNTTTTSPPYRVSVPKPKQPSNRVPAHLQGIRYVYEDSDDVIHIIEPPQHFQLLKRLINRTNDQRKVGITWSESTNQMPMPTVIKPATNKALSASKLQTKVNKLPGFIVRQAHQVKQQIGGIKVNRPVTLLQTYKHRRKPVGSNEDSTDLMSSETQVQQLPILLASSALPRDFLTSVRTTERVLQQQPQQRQHLQRVTHRQTKRTSHTVIIGQVHELNKFQQGSDHKIMEEKWRRARVRRETSDISGLEGSLAGARRDGKQPSALNVLKNAKLDIQKGTRLLLHLDDLLKNANLYLPDEGEVVDLTAKHSISKERNFERVTQSTTYPGAFDLREFVEKSLNATNLLKDKFSPKRRNENERRRMYVNKQWNIPEDISTTKSDRYTTGALLYDDVMTNIRNMLQKKNLQLLEDQQNRNFNAATVPVDLSSSSSSVFIDNGDMIETKKLYEYINDLQRMVKHFPNSDISTEPTLEVQKPTNMTDSTDRFFINAKGSIYGARLASRPKLSTSLFHRFPDIPLE